MFMQQLSWNGNAGEDDEAETNEGAFQMDDDLGMCYLLAPTHQDCRMKTFRRIRRMIRSQQRKRVIPVPLQNCSWNSSSETR